MWSDDQARAEHGIAFALSAWEANCPQQINGRTDAAAVSIALEAPDTRVGYCGQKGPTQRDVSLPGRKLVVV